MLSQNLRNLAGALESAQREGRFSKSIFDRAVFRIRELAADAEELERHQVPPAARIAGNDPKIVSLDEARDRRGP